MAGQKITAPTARDWGLIDDIAAPDHLVDQAKAYAADALGATAAHVAGIKRLC
jgi:enoyl-CoA hydratase/carnithine racemase